MWMAELCDAKFGLAELAPPITGRTSVQQKVFSEDFREKTSQRGKPEFTEVGEASAGDSVGSASRR